jgi:type II secretory pathway component PulJ
MTQRKFNHGIMLTELLFVMAILVVILALEAQLFNSSMRTIAALPLAQARASQLNQMTTALGRDVWGASTIELTGPRQVALGYPDGSSTRWDFNDDGRITRSPSTQPSESRQWNVTPSPTLERTASGLMVKTSSKLSDATDSRPLFSQMLVLTEENR